MHYQVGFKISSLASAVILAGCGSGGSPANVNTLPNPNTIKFATPTQVDVYDPLNGNSLKNPITDIYVKDLNNDDSDEVVVGGRITQPTPANEWQTFNMQIYGWNTGKFSNETSTWFNPGENVTAGTSGIQFGDFNGDGKTDMFAQPDTDMNNFYAKPWVFYNTGDNSFDRELVHNFDQWAHSSHVGDYNGDGYDDIMMPAYGTAFTVNFGGPNGFTTYTTNGIDVAGTPGYASGASISVGNFLNDGSTTIVLTDASQDPKNDVKLIRVYAQEQNKLQTQEIATLPQSRFYLPKWSQQLAQSPTDPHAIRNWAFDFNGDGLDDVIIMDSLGSADEQWHAYSELQFLENRGNGTFVDVTDSVLVGYDTSKTASYNPLFVDFNNDGLTDIFLSYQDGIENGNYTASRILLQTSDGKFVEKFGDVFEDFHSTINSTGGLNGSWYQPIQIVSGPDNEKYLFGGVTVNQSGDVKTKTFLAKIGTTGTVTPQNVFDTIKTNWPYLTDEEVTNLMASTGSDTINGFTVVNLNIAMNPVGGITLNNGPLAGTTIRLPNLDSSKFSELAGFDDAGRHYYLNLSRSTNAVESNFTSYSSAPNQSYSTGININGVNAYGNNTTYGFGADTSLINPNNPWKFGITMSKNEQHPWMNFAGAFGKLNYAENFEIDVNRRFNNGTWAKVGLIQTKTDFTPGLVSNVEDIWSSYAVAGYSANGLNLYGGIEPTIVSGSITFNLPESVDSSGNPIYNSYTMEVRNTLTNFVGLDYTHSAGIADVTFESRANANGNYNVGVKVNVPW